MAVSVMVKDDAVDIAFSGLDELMCLSTGVRLPMPIILGARVGSVLEASADRGWRVLGTYLPGVAACGHYQDRRRKGARQLWDVYRDSEVLIIDTMLDRPTKVVLQHPNRHDLAWYIGERIHA
jgi:hypothetical protein